MLSICLPYGSILGRASGLCGPQPSSKGDLREPREPRGGRRGRPGGPAKIFTPQLRWYAVQEFPFARANRRETAPESQSLRPWRAKFGTPAALVRGSRISLGRWSEPPGNGAGVTVAVTLAREIWDPSCVGTRFKNFPWSILGMTWCAFFCGRWPGPPQLCLRSPTRVGPS